MFVDRNELRDLPAKPPTVGPILPNFNRQSPAATIGNQSPRDSKPSTQKAAPATRVDPSDKFHKNAAAVQEAIKALSERIDRFENYLCQLPGRVEAHHIAEDPDVDGSKLVLHFHGKGKAWTLSYGLWNPADQEEQSPVNYRPLREASVRIKIESVKHLPAILKAVEKGQEDLRAAILSATAQFDSFFADIEHRGEAK